MQILKLCVHKFQLIVLYKKGPDTGYGLSKMKVVRWLFFNSVLVTGEFLP